MRWLNKLGDDVFDHNLGKILAMAVFAAVAFATLFLEHDYLVAFYEAFGYFAYNFSTFYSRSTYFYCTVGVYEENAVEFDGCTVFYFAKVVHIQETIFLGLELLTLDFYDYVHL